MLDRFILSASMTRESKHKVCDAILNACVKGKTLLTVGLANESYSSFNPPTVIVDEAYYNTLLLALKAALTREGFSVSREV